jgi:hypothetical protein
MALLIECETLRLLITFSCHGCTVLAKLHGPLRTDKEMGDFRSYIKSAVYGETQQNAYGNATRVIIHARVLANVKVLSAI